MVEQMWDAQSQEQMNMAVRREEKEELARRAKSKQVATQQLQQLRVHQEGLARAKQRSIAEGRKIKEAALEDIREAERVEAGKRAQLKRNNAEYVRANIEQQKLRALRAQAEKREEEKIQEYAKEKEMLEQKRREYEKAKADKKASDAERMRAEEERLDQEQAAREAQGNQRVEAENLWQEQQRENIRASRENQIRIKADEQERTAYVDAIMAQEWKRRAETMKQIAIDEDRREFAKNLKHAKFLKSQSAETRVNKRLDKIRDLEAARLYKYRQKEGDRVYEQYAQENIGMFAAQGRSVIPMKLTLRKQKARQVKLVVE